MTDGPATTAVYRGTVMHHRLSPRRHRFSYRVRSFLFDIDTLTDIEKRCRFFSLDRFNLFSFYRRDYGAGTDEMPRQYLERSLREHGVGTPLGSATMLCYPRILGFTFNPLTVYFCHTPDGRLFTVLYEVSNTFGERHSYLLPVSPGEAGERVRQHCDKAFYVSPFMPMNQRYHFRIRPPADDVEIGIRQTENGRHVMTALLRGTRRPLNDGELLRCFFGMPLMTLKVVLAIHWEALRLWLKGLPLQRRPSPPARRVTFTPARTGKQS